MGALYKFSEVEAKKANPATLREIIKDVLRADDDACYVEMEPFLIPPGRAGSREYDHAYAVAVLLKHDALHGGRIATVMESTGLSRRMIWDEIVKVYRAVGFKVRNGRLVGLLEDHSKSDDDNGRDDSIE